MKFWDSSALIPLLVDEAESLRAAKLLKEDSSIVVWWGTSIECISALSRLERSGLAAADEVENLVERLRILQSAWREVQPGTSVRKIAERLLRVHPLRAQDAQQLAACVLVNSDHPVPLVAFDERLSTAARKEGLKVVT